MGTQENGRIMVTSSVIAKLQFVVGKLVDLFIIY